MDTARIHLLAVALALSTCLLAGCVLAEVHFTASPIPPWIQLDVKGLDDSSPAAATAPRPTTATDTSTPR